MAQTVVKHDIAVNTSFVLPITSNNLTTGLGLPLTYTCLKDGVVFSLPTPTFAEIGGGLYTMAFTPTSTGLYTIFVQGAIQGTVNVVTNTAYTLLTSLQDEALGSWTWDKVAGTLVLYSQSGPQIATFSVVDNLTTASRQRTG